MNRKALLIAMIVWGAAAPVGAKARDTRPGAAADSLTIRRAAQDSTRAFVKRWRETWQSDIASVHDVDFGLGELRKAYGHCHSLANGPDEYTDKMRKHYPVMKGKASSASMCPTWFLGPLPIPGDDDESFDGSLLPSHRDVARTARARLLLQLETAGEALPNDVWIMNQRVRFLIDQGIPDEALRVARECRDARWWCSALAGYALHAGRSYVSADSAFSASIAALPEYMKCDWTDIQHLLPDSAALEYGTASCAARDSMATRYWWLADPFHSVPGNERRTEHYARRVMAMLHSTLEEDERYHWLPAYGGDAVSEMMMRYGWPTASVWVGSVEDKNHDQYLRSAHSLTSAPYSTAEYAPNRVHFGAEWSAVRNPYAARAVDWELNAPADQRTSPTGKGDFWWPLEHMRVPGQFVMQYPEGQTSFFPRKGGIRMAAAIEFANPAMAPFQSSAREGVTTALVASTTPDSSVIVSRTTSNSGARVAVTGTIPARPVLLSIESVPASAGATTAGAAMRYSARTRFGATPPNPLDSLKAGVIAISDPAFFSAGDTTSLPDDIDEMLPRMLGRTTVSQSEKLGVFWESYGIVGGDSVRFGVNVSSTTGRSFIQRLASALKLAPGPTGNVEVSWVDLRRKGGAASENDGPTVLPSAIVLDLASLPKGTYLIEVVVTVRGKEPVRAQRALTIN